MLGKCWNVVIITGLTVFWSVRVVDATLASNHLCNRKCVDGINLDCEYNFTVENYFVLSRACYQCPFNKSDCFRPHCVSSNGLKRNILAINRTMPGPSIEVCKGDKVRVWVDNRIEDGSSISIHWHGVIQRGTNYMDGVGRITQCNILPNELFKYEFTADNAGTHWYHAHVGLQLGDGLYGAFIVREPKSHRLRHLYNEDKSDHIMMINDWIDRPQMHRYMEEMQDQWTLEFPINVLVNGRGRKHYVTDPTRALKLETYPSSPTLTPYEMFSVDANKKYRFRTIASATRCYFRVMIDNHTMTMIASDGSYMKMWNVGSFMIHPGERYDFVLHTNAAPGDYWIKIESYGDCIEANMTGHGAAILHYNGYNGNNDMMPNGDVMDFTRNDTILNPITEQLEWKHVKVFQGENRHYSLVEENYTNEKVDVRYYIGLRYQTNDNTYYSHPTLYPQSARIGIETPTMNNITLYLPSAPLATQWDDVTNKNEIFCNSSTINISTDCTDNLCFCTHMMQVELGQVVELFIASQAEDHHPLHLHGQSFRVVGDGLLTKNQSDINEYLKIPLADVIARDRAGEFPRILVNPWHKDTLVILGLGRYNIIRFKAENPGVWIFHCHNEGHMMQGMGMIIIVGDKEQFPKPKDYFPKCGGYRYPPQPENVCKPITRKDLHMLKSLMCPIQ